MYIVSTHILNLWWLHVGTGFVIMQFLFNLWPQFLHLVCFPCLQHMYYFHAVYLSLPHPVFYLLTIQKLITTHHPFYDHCC